MAGEAVSGRYGAARHTVADEAEGRTRGPRHPATDGRSLVDRLLAGNGDDRGFDWGWGDPATGELVTDRGPLHDIPELWGPEERAARGGRSDLDDPEHGDAHPDERDPFPTPRLNGDNPLEDPLEDPLGSGPLDDLGHRSGDVDMGRDLANRDSRDREFAGPEFDEPSLDAGARDDRGRDEPGRDVPGGEDEGRADRGLDGDPLDALSRLPNGGPGDTSEDREASAADPLERIRAIGRPHRGPQVDDRRQPDRLSPGVSNSDRFGLPPVDRDPLAREWPHRDPLDPAPPTHESLDLDRPDRDPLGGEPAEDHEQLDRDPPQRLRADHDRPAGGRLGDGDPVNADPVNAYPFDAGSFDRDPFDRDQLEHDPFGAGQAAPDRPGPGSHLDDDPAADGRFADPALATLADPTLADSVLTGRIRVADADGAGSDHDRPHRAINTTADDPADDAPDGPAMFDDGASGPLDPVPAPTTVLSVVGAADPARGGATEEPASALQEYAARRRAAEQAAASAEEAAASAAERASAAIAAAARAAEEAEAAAEVAARAAEEAHEAAEAEARAIAAADSPVEAPGRPDRRVAEPEPPTQAVPRIAPASGRPSQRRPAGPPREARPAEPRRPSAPKARAAHRIGSPRDSSPREAGRDGADGEATAVLTGMQSLRGSTRSRDPEPASTEVTSVVRRRRAAEPAGDTDEGDEAEHDQEPGRALARRLTTRPVLAAAGVGAVIAVAAVVATFTASDPEPPPAEARPAALAAPVAVQPPPPTASAVDPDSAKAVTFLTALRDADIPTSSSGQAETEAAAAICAQLDQGADEAQLARSVPAVLPDVTRGQASEVVDYAQQHYC